MQSVVVIQLAHHLLWIFVFKRLCNTCRLVLVSSNCTLLNYLFLCNSWLLIAFSTVTVLKGSLSASYIRIIFATNCLRYWSLKFAITPWSIGCQWEVVFRGSYSIRTFKRPCFPPTNCTPTSWPEKLSNNSKTFLPCIFILLFSPVIHFDLLYQYWTRNWWRFRFLKQRRFFDLLITHILYFSEPSALHVKASVIRSLAFFPPVHECVVSVRFGDIFQTLLRRLVSFLYIN